MNRDKEDELDLMLGRVERRTNQLIRAAELKRDTPLEYFESMLYISESLQKDNQEALARMGTMIEHILKLSFCHRRENDKKWAKTIQNTHRALLDLTGWDSKKENSGNRVKYLRKHIDDAYQDGIDAYSRARKEYSDLPAIEDRLPEKCIWTLDELMNADFTIEDEHARRDEFKFRNPDMKKLYTKLIHLLEDD